MDRYYIVAPDLRGHGDSEWALGNAYSSSDFVYDVSQLVEHLEVSKLSIIGHSLGGSIALKYTGLYPETVRRVVSIEGLGPSPKKLALDAKKTADVKYDEWLLKMKRLKRRSARNSGFDSLDKAIERMRQVHGDLSSERLHHLTRYGCRRNEEDQYVWKADPYVRANQPFDMAPESVAHLWSTINCPVLLVHGGKSWASNPEQDGRSRHFRNVQVVSIPDAGHAVHHDQFEAFVDAVAVFF
jgi:pimeloyl-ACP methyl ester carboxylesterase